MCWSFARPSVCLLSIPHVLNGMHSFPGSTHTATALSASGAQGSRSISLSQTQALPALFHFSSDPFGMLIKP